MSLILVIAMALPISPEPYTVKQFLQIRAAWAPQPSPDGRWVAYLTNITGTPQIWRIDVDGGCPQQLTFFDEPVRGLRVSPDGRWIAFLSDTGGNERYQIYLTTPDGDSLWNLTRHPEAIHYLADWSPDGWRLAFSSNRRDPAVFDIYLYDLTTGKDTLIWQTDGYYTALRFSPDGEKLLVRQARSNYDHDLFLVDLETGERRHLTPHKGWVRYYGPEFSPDGERLYLITDQGREYLGLAYLDLKKGGLVYVDTPSWDYEEFTLSPDGRWLAVLINEGGYSRFFLRDLRTGEVWPIQDLPPGNYGGLIFPQSSQRLFFHLSAPTENADLWVLELNGLRVRRLTWSPTAGIPKGIFVSPRKVTYRSFDGLEIPAFLYLPRSSGEPKPPAIVWVHGGPESQYRPGFSGLFQFFLYHGYAVFAPNVRGSAGYGKTYLHLDDKEKRLDSVRDLAEGVRWLKGSGLVDPDRIAVMGASYGGYMVLAGLTFYPDFFAAGVDIVGIANFKTFLEKTGPYRRKLREAEYGSLEDEALLRRISPIHYVDRIRAPLLLIHGRNDPRVPVYEAQQIYEALKARNHPVELLIFEDEGHGIAKLENRLRAYSRVVAFLDRYLKGEE